MLQDECMFIVITVCFVRFQANLACSRHGPASWTIGELLDLIDFMNWLKQEAAFGKHIYMVYAINEAFRLDTVKSQVQTIGVHVLSGFVRMSFTRILQQGGSLYQLDGGQNTRYTTDESVSAAKQTDVVAAIAHCRMHGEQRKSLSQHPVSMVDRPIQLALDRRVQIVMSVGLSDFGPSYGYSGISFVLRHTHIACLVCLVIRLTSIVDETVGSVNEVKKCALCAVFGTKYQFARRIPVAFRRFSSSWYRSTKLC
ncbi:hypothetical protein CLF_105749 [Clonorchis sinensis]|uniref:Uncharacterized protein n=1 Tax=Clonorchis sinensis TaxID=79923 RepID=G7YE49_CLOSI|nr:hypothetical protein CLF_105749 [Clonorchis sinensis]